MCISKTKDHIMECTIILRGHPPSDLHRVLDAKKSVAGLNHIFLIYLGASFGWDKTYRGRGKYEIYTIGPKVFSSINYSDHFPKVATACERVDMEAVCSGPSSCTFTDTSKYLIFLLAFSIISLNKCILEVYKLIHILFSYSF